MHGFPEITLVTMKNFPTNRGDPQSILQGLSKGVIGSRRLLLGGELHHGKGGTQNPRGSPTPTPTPNTTTASTHAPWGEEARGVLGGWGGWEGGGSCHTN
jgi:hypothetical protein